MQLMGYWALIPWSRTKHHKQGDEGLTLQVPLLVLKAGRTITVVGSVSKAQSRCPSHLIEQYASAVLFGTETA